MWKKRAETTWERGVVVKLISKTSSCIRSIQCLLPYKFRFRQNENLKLLHRPVTCSVPKVNFDVNKFESCGFSRELQSYCTKHHETTNIPFCTNSNRPPNSAATDFISYCFTSLIWEMIAKVLQTFFVETLNRHIQRLSIETCK